MVRHCFDMKYGKGKKNERISALNEKFLFNNWLKGAK